VLKKPLLFRLSLILALAFSLGLSIPFARAQEEAAPSPVREDVVVPPEPEKVIKQSVGLSAPEMVPGMGEALPQDVRGPSIGDVEAEFAEEEEAAEAEFDMPIAPEKKPDLTELTTEGMLKAYNDFMKMAAPRRVEGIQKEGETTEAKENPIWKFHSWLQDQLALMEETGGAGLLGKGGLEDLCYVCHNGKLVINPNFSGDQKGLRQVFQLTSRHPVRDSDKSKFYDPLHPDDPTKSDPIWERKIQCVTCHNPAVVTGRTPDGGYPLTLPTDPENSWTQKLIDGWPTLDNPPWPHDTPPRPLVYGRPYLDDPDLNVQGDEVLGPDSTELPNFTSYCQTCHRQISGRYGVSNNYSRLKYDPIRYIKGDGGGNIATHGMARGRESSTKNLRLREPFFSLRTDEDGNVINNLYLSCTDCHEPHGSINAFLMRTKVNGVKGVRVGYEGKFYSLCSKCHYIANPWPGGYPHGSPGDMSERTCIQCHNHAAGGGRF